MSLKNSHKKRVEKIKNFTNKNKLFTIISVLVLIYLLFNFVSSKKNHVEKSFPETSISDGGKPVAESETNETASDESDEPHWKFYWIDLWILGGAGGFCTIMLILERRKAREKLK